MLHLKNEYTYEDILNAYLDCRRRKRSTLPATDFEANCEMRLQDLLEEVNADNYQISPTRVFVVLRPKAREVWVAQFRDRVVHHLIHNGVASHIEKTFIEDTY